MSDSEEEDTDKIDFSVISNSIEIGGTMVEQIINGIHYGSGEVRNLLRNECDFIMECKICRNLFRSFPNFVAHKRVYCTEMHVSRLFNPLSSLRTQTTSEETVVVQPKSPNPSTETKKNQQQKSNSVLEDLKKNSFSGKSSAYKVYSKASEKVEAEKINTKVSKVVLTPISTNPNAMFVSVSSDSTSKTEKSGTDKSDSASKTEKSGTDKSDRASKTEKSGTEKSDSTSKTEKSGTDKSNNTSNTEKSGKEKSDMNISKDSSALKSSVSEPIKSSTASPPGESMLRKILERRDEPKMLDKANKLTVWDKAPDKTSIAMSRSPRKKKEEVKSGSVPSTKSPVKGEANTKSVPRSPVKVIPSVAKSLVKRPGDANPVKSKETAPLAKVILRPVQSNLGSELRSNLTKLSKQGFVHISRLQCLICGSVFASKKSLSNHMSYTHSGKMLIYPCLLCSKKYNRFFGVTRHLQKFHNKTHQEIIKMTPKLKEIAIENTQNIQNESEKATKGKMMQKTSKATEASDKESESPQAHKSNSNLRFERQKKIIVVSPHSKSTSSSSSVALYKCTGCGKTFLKKASCSEHVRICQAVNFPALSAKFSEHKRPKNKLQQMSSANKKESDKSSDSEEESMCVSEEEKEKSEQKISPAKESPKKSKDDKEASPKRERVIQTRRSAAAQYMKTRFLDKRRAIVKQNAIKTSRSASARNVSNKEASASKSGTPEKKISPKKSNSSDQERNSSADRNLFNLFNKVSNEDGGPSKDVDRGRHRVRQIRETEREGSSSSDLRSSRDTSIDSRYGTQKRSSSRDSERKTSKYLPSVTKPMETRSRLSSFDSITDKKSDVSRSSTPSSESKSQKATSSKESNAASFSESKSPAKSTDNERQVTPSENTSLSSYTRLKEEDLESESEVSDYDASSRVIVTSVKDASTKKVKSGGKRSRHIFALQGKISADESDSENGNSDNESGSSEKEEEEKKDDVDNVKCESSNQQEIMTQESRSRRKQKMVVREIDEVDGTSIDEKNTKRKSGSRKSTGKITEGDKKSKSSKSATIAKEKSPSETRRSRNYDDTGKISLDNILYTSRDRKVKSKESDESDSNQTSKSKNSSNTEQTDTNHTSKTKISSNTEQSPNGKVENNSGANQTKNGGSEPSKARNVNSNDIAINHSVQISSKAVKLVPYPATSTLQKNLLGDITQDTNMAGTTRIRHRSLESYSTPLGNVEHVSVAGARLIPSFLSPHIKSVQNKNLEELFNKKLMDASITPTRAQILDERQNLSANSSVSDEVAKNKNVVRIEEIWVDKKQGAPLEKVKTNTIVVENGEKVQHPQTIIVEKPTKPAKKKMYVIDLDSTGETKPKCLDTKHIESLIDSNSLQCRHCCTTFASYGNLRRHVVRHLGWKRYKCKLCKFTSYNRSECSTHLLRAHAEKCITTSVSSYIIDLNKEASKARTQKKQQTLQKNLQSGEDEEDQVKRKTNLRRGAQEKNEDSKKSPIKKGIKKTSSESKEKSNDTPQSDSATKNSAGKSTTKNRKRKRSLDDEEEKGERKARFDTCQSESPRKRSASYDEACTSRPLSKNEIHDLCDELTSASDTENDQNNPTSPIQKLEPNVETMASVLEWARKVRFSKKGKSNLRRLSSPLKKGDKPVDDVMSKSLDGTSSVAIELHEGSEEEKIEHTSSNNDTATECRQPTKSYDEPILSKILVKDIDVKEESQNGS